MSTPFQHQKSGFVQRPVGNVVEYSPGKYVVRFAPDAKLTLGKSARLIGQADGSYRIEFDLDTVRIKEVARRLGLPETTVRRLIESGELTAHKTSPRRWEVLLASVQDYQARCKSGLWVDRAAAEVVKKGGLLTN